MLECENCGSQQVTLGDYWNGPRIRCNDCHYIETILKDNDMKDSPANENTSQMSECDHGEKFSMTGAINGCIACQAAHEAMLKTEAREAAGWLYTNMKNNMLPKPDAYPLITEMAVKIYPWLVL